MASRKRTKPLPVKNRHRKKSQEAVLKRINKIEDLNGFGAREEVISSYFSTMYFLTRNRHAWGNSASYYHGPNFALNPEDLFHLAEKIKIQPGAKYEIHPQTVLVARGEKHSLAILFNWDLYPSLNKIDYVWKLIEGTPPETFSVSDAELRVMSFFNWPHSSW